jgi:hypothetical protein
MSVVSDLPCTGAALRAYRRRSGRQPVAIARTLAITVNRYGALERYAHLSEQAAQRIVAAINATPPTVVRLADLPLDQRRQVVAILTSNDAIVPTPDAEGA